MLLSLSLVSNRPRLFTEMLQNLEATAVNCSEIEVLVGIDDGDFAMRDTVMKEAARRPLEIKWLSEPRSGFFSLWPTLNRMHRELCARNAYFVQHYNDEIRLRTPAWDRVLKRYVGLFPDEIFRLRVSKHKEWNYLSLVEAGSFPENFPITTKRWIDITGWATCHSADSFQQCIALWLADGPWGQKRDVPVHDISFSGLDAGSDLDEPARRRHQALAVKGWLRLFSNDIQTAANQLAKTLQAHIWAAAQGKQIHTRARGRRLEVIDSETGALIQSLDFSVPPRTRWGLEAYRLRLALGHAYRTLHTK
jgi:hypothetical protein